MSVAYDWAGNGPTHAPVSGTVATIPGDNADGCDAVLGGRRRPRSPARSPGWSGTTTTPPDAAARPPGLPTSGAPVRSARSSPRASTCSPPASPATPTIPVFQLPKAGTDRLRPAAEAGTLQGDLRRRPAGDRSRTSTTSISDTLSGFSSRGVHGSLGVVKPDVTAPATPSPPPVVGTGTDPLSISGTSMASPLTAGVSALVAAKHPDYTPLMVKAAVMNNGGARRVDRASTSRGTPMARTGWARAGWMPSGPSTPT